MDNEVSIYKEIQFNQLLQGHYDASCHLKSFCPQAKETPILYLEINVTEK